MANTVITIFPKSDKVVVTQEKGPNNESIYVNTYSYLNKPVCWFKTWYILNERGQVLPTKVEFKDLTQ